MLVNVCMMTRCVCVGCVVSVEGSMLEARVFQLESRLSRICHRKQSVVVVNDDEVRAVLACVRRCGWCLEDDFSHDDSDD